MTYTCTTLYIITVFYLRTQLSINVVFCVCIQLCVYVVIYTDIEVIYTCIESSAFILLFTFTKLYLRA